jgi:thioesterase domain-containing protein
VAGYCAGGAIAFESARQLAAAGQEVARVVLFGSPFPTVYRESRARLYARSLTHRARRHTDVLRQGSLKEDADYVWERLRGRATAAASRLDPSLANRRRVEDATVDAVRRYTPLYYHGRVDVIFPSEAWRDSGDRPEDWRLVATQVVEHVGPAGVDGDDMLREPHVRATTALLEEALDD